MNPYVFIVGCARSGTTLLQRIVVSDYNLAYLRESYGSAARRVRRIYNGLDLGRFPYRSPRDRPPRIVGVGRLVEKKGFVDLIEACAINSFPPAPRAETWPVRGEYA